MSQTHPINRSKNERRRPPSMTLLNLQVERGQGRERLYQQIRESIRSAIVGGQVGGRRLPPTREMAAALGVNRATVARAYQELEADGLVESRGAQGTAVVGPSLEAAPPAFNGGPPAWVSALAASPDPGLRADPTLIRDITFHSRRPDVISFAGAAPDADLIPHQRIERALAAGLERLGPRALSYAPVEGLEPLREALTGTLARSLLRDGESLMVVSGATQGLALAARVLIEPGDEVVVESPAYFGVLQAFALAGARLIGVPTDRHGLRTDHLEAILAQRRVRLVIVQPRFQNPTGAVLSPERRSHLLLLARRYAVPVLEDDLYGDLVLDGKVSPPLKAEDRAGSVVYLSSFSKSISPGLRLGWLVAPDAAVQRFVVAKQFADLTTNSLAQVVTAELLASGEYAEHLARVTGEYRARRDALVAALRDLNGAVEPTAVPTGGSHLWCRLAPGLRSRGLAAAAIRRGVVFTPGEAFYPPGAPGAEPGSDRARLCFTAVSPRRMAEGVARLAAAIGDLPAAPVGSPRATGILV